MPKKITAEEAGTRGGKATLKIKGREHYVAMAEKRWGKLPRDAKRAAAMAGLSPSPRAKSSISKKART